MDLSQISRSGREPGRGDARGEWAVAIAIVFGIAIALTLLLGIQESRAAQNETKGCGDVVVQFKPEGSGGAHAIQATNVDCEPARNIAKSCLKGTVVAGWTAVNWDGKTELTKGDKKIRYTPVGGGGCELYPKSCRDFGYRGVGFFNVQVVGIACSGGASTARAWYDKGGDCHFGSACDVGEFHCKANAGTGTVTCRKPNGFRVRWEMGE